MLWSALLALFVFCAACNHNSPDAANKPAGTSPLSSSGQTDGQGNPRLDSPSASDTPIKDAVETLLTQQESAEHPFLPRGLRLLGVDFKDGVASLDFSKEFIELTSHGDTVESDAQKALRRALAGVRGVEKMRVTVEGKSFDSQATDWNTPFPVRETDADAQATQLDAADKGSHPN